MPDLNDALDAIKTAQGKAMQDTNDLTKSFTQPDGPTTGLQAYDLEAPSKKFYPVLTPLRNSISRVTNGFATQANWRVITAINVNN
ncbi:hypothetical protein KWF38_19610, partial [Acinetobacter pittii]